MSAVENDKVHDLRIHKTSACQMQRRGLRRYGLPGFISQQTGRRVSCAFEGHVLKRFTETTKWNDPWFMGLSLEAKLLWLYLCDNCDNAGVIDFNAKLAAVQIGKTMEEHHFAELVDRIQRLPTGKIWVPKFVKFQFGTLSPNCKPHASVLSLIESHHLNDTAIKPYVKGMDTLQEKDKEKDQEKERGMQGGIPTTELQAVEWAGMEAVPKEFAAEIYQQQKARDWVDGAGQHVTNWRAYVKSRFSKSKRIDHETDKRNRQPGNRPAVDRNAGTANARAIGQYDGLGKVL